jgi:hypothetical protein
MPSSAIRRRLAPASFHQELVRAMADAGFTRMYQFTATTDQDAYHVPIQYAQQTTHFFYLPDRGFLVQFALSEDIDKEGQYRSWWDGAVYLQLGTRAMIEHEVYNVCPQHDGPQFFMDSCEPLGHIMGDDVIDELLAPFQTRGGSRVMDFNYDDSYGWLLERSGFKEDALTVDQIVRVATGLRDHFAPFQLPKLSHDFSAWFFISEYAWPGIRERFWRSFPTRLLKQLVPGRIRGRESTQTRSR